MPLDLERIQAVCFDIDGTLSDTDDLMVSRIARRLLPLKHLLPGRDPHRAARRLVMAIESPGSTALSLADRLHLDSYLGWLFSRLSRSRPGHDPLAFRIIQGVPELLATLSQRFPLAVISANQPASVYGFLDHFNLGQYFKVVVTAQTCAHTKPYPDPLLYAAREMGVLPSACLMVGDTTIDIRTGRAAEAQTVGVLCGFGTQRELARRGANLILPATPELATVLLMGK
jgi:phosphoglycolate phosphatase-like HAD superfamily hydrolase